MKEFFKQKWVRIVACLMVVIGSIALIVGGVSAEEISSIVEAVKIAVVSIGGVIALICAIAIPSDKK
ncbi:MAG: hypothetical protein MJ181_10815 [Treponema sp.]|nr:hypothetical protein [Treponema sp.]